MWEVRAAAGRVDALLAWALTVTAGCRADVYRGAGDADRVVVLLHDPAGDLPPPPDGLCDRPPHAWDFELVTRPGTRATPRT